MVGGACFEGIGSLRSRHVDKVSVVAEGPLWCEEAHQWAGGEALRFNLQSAALQLALLREAQLWFGGRLVLFVELIAHCFLEELKDVGSSAQLRREVLHSSAFGIETLIGEGRASVSEGSSVGE